MSPADDIELRAAQWLQRREELDWTPADEAELDRWLAESAAHKLAYWRLEHGWEKIGRLAVLKHASPPPATRRFGFPAWVAVGTGLVALLLAVFAIPAATPELVAQRYETAIGGHKTVPLADGSKIELGTNTDLRARVSSDKRTVWLDRGEAYFEVKHDPAHPFVVYAGVRKVTVLGTKFLVRHDGDEVRVVVVSGRVRVDPTDLNGPAREEVLTDGQMALTTGVSTLVASPTPAKVDSMLSWRRGMLTFDQTALSDVAEEFNRYNNVKLALDDPTIGAMRISGAFQAENVEAFARLLQSAYALKVTRRGDVIEISS